MKKVKNQLPLLEKVRSIYQFLFLNDAYLICAQHLLKTSVTLFHNLFEMGLNPKFFSVIGKCYSTNPFVYFDLKFLQKLDVCPSSQKFDASQSFDIQYTANIQNFIKQRVDKIIGSQCRRLIVVDDGGELIQAVQQLVEMNILPLTMEIVSVEQTSSGFRKLQSSNLNFPVVNVARSDAKLHLESSLIASSIMANLWKAFSNIDFKPTRALVLGKGAIGTKVEKQLNNYCVVDSFDPIKNDSSFRSFEQIDFSHYNLILGCSGKEIMRFSNFKSVTTRTVLASASSSDREFSGITFRNKSNQILTCHDHIHIDHLCLLNCGFPVNFSDQYNLVDDERYQLTRALLLGGILQAYSLVDLSEQFINLNLFLQHSISEQFLSLYSDIDQDDLEKIGSTMAIRK